MGIIPKTKNRVKVENNYVVTVVNMDKSIFDDKVKEEKVRLEIRLPNASSLKNAYLFSVDDRTKRNIDFILKKEKIEISFIHKTSSLILLSEG